MEVNRKKKGKEHPIGLKRKIIEQIDRGEITPEAAAKELGVHPGNIARYRRQLAHYGDACSRGRKKIPMTLKRTVVRQIEAGELTKKEAMIKCGLTSVSPVNYWIKQFGCRALEQTIGSTMEVALKTGNNQQIPKGNISLQEQLHNSHLKIALLETLIDLADQEFKTNIRKKAGAKQ